MFCQVLPGVVRPSARGVPTVPQCPVCHTVCCRVQDWCYIWADDRCTHYHSMSRVRAHATVQGLTLARWWLSPQLVLAAIKHVYACSLPFPRAIHGICHLSFTLSHNRGVICNDDCTDLSCEPAEGVMDSRELCQAVCVRLHYERRVLPADEHVGGVQ